MLRISTVLAIASVAAASAAQIQVGGVNGLTSSYITSGCSGGGPCIAGSTGSFSEQNYDTVLFSGASNGSTTPVPYATYSTTAANTGSITDGPFTFNMINDGLTGDVSKNVWIGGTTPVTQDTITVPIGVFGVDGVLTMLNSDLGLAGPARDATVEFDFASTSNGAITTAIKVKPTNDAVSGVTAGDSMQNAVQCPSSSACSTLANGAPAATVSTPSGNFPGVLMASDLLPSTNFNYTIATGAYAGTVGNVSLTDQVFIFGGTTLATALSSYLVDIKIIEPNLSGTDAIGLSAITLDTAVPEPSTVLMLLTGLGAIGFARFRRK